MRLLYPIILIIMLALPAQAQFLEGFNPGGGSGAGSWLASGTYSMYPALPGFDSTVAKLRSNGDFTIAGTLSLAATKGITLGGDIVFDGTADALKWVNNNFKIDRDGIYTAGVPYKILTPTHIAITTVNGVGFLGNVPLSKVDVTGGGVRADSLKLTKSFDFTIPLGEYEYQNRVTFADSTLAITLSNTDPWLENLDGVWHVKTGFSFGGVQNNNQWRIFTGVPSNLPTTERASNSTYSGMYIGQNASKSTFFMHDVGGSFWLTDFGKYNSIRYSTVRLAITKNGIGVFTMFPSSKLTVTGGIKADTIIAPIYIATADSIEWTIGADSIDCSQASVFYGTLTASDTLYIKGMTGNATGTQTVIIKITNANNYTLTWDPAISWADNTPPVITATANKKTVITLVKINGEIIGNAVLNIGG